MNSQSKSIEIAKKIACKYLGMTGKEDKGAGLIILKHLYEPIAKALDILEKETIERIAKHFEKYGYRQEDCAKAISKLGEKNE